MRVVVKNCLLLHQFNVLSMLRGRCHKTLFFHITGNSGSSITLSQNVFVIFASSHLLRVTSLSLTSLFFENVLCPNLPFAIAIGSANVCRNPMSI